MYINIKFRIVNTIEYYEYNKNDINFTFKLDICIFVILLNLLKVTYRSSGPGVI